MLLDMLLGPRAASSQPLRLLQCLCVCGCARVLHAYASEEVAPYCRKLQGVDESQCRRPAEAARQQVDGGRPGEVDPSIDVGEVPQQRVFECKGERGGRHVSQHVRGIAVPQGADTALAQQARHGAGKCIPLDLACA